MPDLTQNLGLQKPLENEVADIAVINQNMDEIGKKFGVGEGEGHIHNGEVGQGGQISYNDLKGKPTLAAVATSGSYNDLGDKPAITPAGIGAIPNSAGSVTDSYIGNRTADQTQVPTGAAGTITQLFSWLANRIKAITGKMNWYDAPDTTLAAANTHINDTTAAHGATSAAIANKIMIRDASGRAKVAIPSASDDVARKDTVDAVQTNLNTHTALTTTAHGGIVPSSDVVTSPAANKILKLDGSGKFPISAITQGAGSSLEADLLWNASRYGLVPTGANVLSGADGNVTISSNANLSKKVNCYNNLTINSGCTLSAPSPGVWIIGVKGTLALNGIISANGVGGAGGASRYASGGSGGGIIVIIANTITGMGSVQANGNAGPNGTGTGSEGGTYYGYNGGILGITLTGGKGGSVGLYTYDTGGTGTSSVYVGDALTSGLFAFSPLDIGGAGGGPGGADGKTNDYYGTGGGGGGGCYGNGGNSGDIGNYTYIGWGGGGGGGGGFIFLLSPNVIPTLNLSAVGGDGGNAYVRSGDVAGGGGGGGGGLIFIAAPSSSASTNVSGGTGGTGCGSGGNGSKGSAGLYVSKTLI